MTIARRWTPEEDDFLRESYPNKQTSEIANYLNRTIAGVHKRAVRLNITSSMEKKPWSPEELDFLRENVPAMMNGPFLDKLATKLGRTKSSIQHQINRLGLSKPKTPIKEWTNEEILYIKENMWHLSYQEIGEKLKRTASSICHKVTRLGWADPQLHFEWTPELRAILDGLLLGDGNLRQNSDYSASFRLSQIATHRDWINYLVEIFSAHKVHTTVDVIPPHRRITKKGVVINSSEHLYLYTGSFATLLPEQQRWYPNKVKIVPKDIDITNSLLLAHWYMGDGTTEVRKYSLFGALCTNGFVLDDIRWLQSEFQTKLGIKTGLKMARKKEPILTFYGKEAEKLFSIIRDKMLPSFKYKTPTMEVK